MVEYEAKSEVRGPFHNWQTNGPLCITLNELGLPQPLKPIKTDNSSAKGTVTATARQKGPRQWICNLLNE